MVKVFSKFIYLMAYSSFKLTLKLVCNVDVWIRHSFIEPTFVPFKSDLDLSVYIKNISDEDKFLKVYKIFKFIFPFLGEVNALSTDKIKILSEHNLNDLYLKRDPILCKKIDLIKRKVSNQDAVAYLLRFLKSDYKNVVYKPKKRFNKWLNHFDQIGSALDIKIYYEKNIDLICVIYNQILALSVCEVSESDRYKLALCFESFQNPHLHYLNHDIASYEKLVWKYLPQEIYRFNNLKVPVLTGNDVQFLKSQLRWEILGFLTLSLGQKQRLLQLNDLACLKIFIGLIDGHDFNDINNLVTIVESVLKSELKEITSGE